MDVERLNRAFEGRYNVEREIGSGGMAVVFLAEDVKHHRKVAIKVLRPDLAAVLGPDRFLQEIRIAAGLTHPHILPLLDSGRSDGLLYYVMPYIEGESLRERLRREGELPVSDAVRLIRDVADALASAHRRGVVHRDIKPDNVLISENHALVTDFGVAKAVSDAADPDAMTTAGVALGTPAYMSPEQAAADPSVDHRTDIYAVGVLAYELLAGRPPFSGTTAREILSAQVIRSPETVTALRPSMPAVLGDIVMRCLEKKPADRWQTADELLARLEAVSTPSGGVTPAGTAPVGPSRSRGRRRVAAVVAVLATAAGLFALHRVIVGPPEGPPPRLVVIPVENETVDPDLDVWAENATSFMVRSIDRAGVVEVAPYTSVREARQALEETGDAGTAALAARVAGTVAVSGRLYRSGDALHIDLELLDPATSKIVRAVGTTTGPGDDPEQVVVAATERLVAAVMAEFDPDARTLVRSMGSPENPESFRHMMQGMDHVCRREYPAAAEALERSIALDSSNVAAWLWAAAVHGNVGRLSDARNAVLAAEALRERHTRLERLFASQLRSWIVDRDWEATYRTSRDMLHYGPEWAYGAAWAAMRTNRLEAAVELLEGYDTEAPCWRNWEPYWEVLAQSLHGLGRHEEELAAARNARTRHPESLNILALEAFALVGAGRVEEADSVWELAYSLPAGPGAMALRTIYVAQELRVHGFDDASVRTLDRLLGWLDAPDGSSRVPLRTAQALFYAGRYEEALTHMEPLVDESPANPVRLYFLAASAALTDRADLADEVDARLEDLGAPFERAYLAAVRGDAPAAVALFDRAIAEGRTHVDMRFPWLHRSPDLLALRGYPPFDRLAEPRR